MQAIDEKSIAGDVKRGYKYMLSAAEGLKNLIEHLNDSEPKRASDIDLFPQVVIVCGKGNNGGDGLALASILSKFNYELSVYCLSDNYKAEAKLAYSDAIEAGVTINFLETAADLKEFKAKLTKDKPEFIVDALLGIGAKGSPNELYATVISVINHHKTTEPNTKIIAVDIPSGLEADTGNVSELAIIADHTVCMGFAKLGFAFYPARSILGELHVRNLDYPATVVRKAHDECIFTPGIKDLIDLMPRRSISGSKFDHGSAIIAAGSKHMGGAAIITASAALEAGLGMLHLCTTNSNISAINSHIPEAVTHALIGFDDDRDGYYNFDIFSQLIANKEPDVVCIGPAFSLEDTAQRFVRRSLDLIEESKHRPAVILDADGINAFRDHHKDLKHKGMDILVTPHYGEFARISPEKITAEKLSKLSPLDKIALLRKFTKATGCNILLKGSPSILVDAKTEQAIVLPYGNSGLAKAGSGDALAGIITALAAQIICEDKRGTRIKTGKLSHTSQAAILGAFLLGKCSETLSKEYGEYSISATKIIENLHTILKAFSAQ